MKTIYLLILLAWIVPAMAETKELKSPTQVYQEFLVAMAQGDATTVERLAIKNKDLAILTSNPIPTKQREKVIAQIMATPYRVLKVGEVFRLPNGKVVGPTEEFEKNDWVFIANDVDPIPHMLQKVGNDWKVDAGDLIAGRKAAAKKRNAQ